MRVRQCLQYAWDIEQKVSNGMRNDNMNSNAQWMKFINKALKLIKKNEVNITKKNIKQIAKEQTPKNNANDTKLKPKIYTKFQDL